MNQDSDFNELHAACFYCSPSGAKRCLRAGFDPNAKDRSGYTPLIWLVRMYDKRTRERKRMFRLLLKHGARIEEKCLIGESVYEYALDGPNSTFSNFVRREYIRITQKKKEFCV